MSTDSSRRCRPPTARRTDCTPRRRRGLFREHGALSFVECWGDDVPDGEVTSFPTAVKCAEDETVCFSWVVWPSKAVRDEAMPKIMEAARRLFETNPMPFGGKRMIYGGFEMIVDA